MAEQLNNPIRLVSRTVTCNHCRLPAVEIRHGTLIVHNRHHGRTHVNTFSLAWLKKVLAEEHDDVVNSGDAT